MKFRRANTNRAIAITVPVVKPVPVAIRILQFLFGKK